MQNLIYIFLPDSFIGRSINILLGCMLVFCVYVIFILILKLFREKRILTKIETIFDRHIENADTGSFTENFLETVGKYINKSRLLTGVIKKIRTNNSLNLNVSYEELRNTIDIDRITPFGSLSNISFLSNLMIIFGLLGTFAGFILMVDKFHGILTAVDTSSVTNLLTSLTKTIKDLTTGIKGMKTAFSTSLTGIISMLTVSLSLLIIQSQFNRYIFKFEDIFKYKVLPALFIPNDEVTMTTLINKIESLINRTEDYTKSTIERTNEYYQKIRNTSETVANFTDKVKNLLKQATAYINSVETKAGEYYANMNTVAHNLQNTSENFAGSVDNIVTMVSSHNKVSEEIRKKIFAMIDYSQKNQQMIKDILVNMNGFTDKFNNISAGLVGNIDNISDLVTTHNEDTVKIKNKLFRMIDSSEKNQKAIKNVLDTINNFSGALQDSVNSQKKNFSKITRITDIAENHYKYMLDEYKEFANALKLENIEMNDKIISKLQKMFMELKKVETEVMKAKQPPENVASIYMKVLDKLSRLFK